MVSASVLVKSDIISFLKDVFISSRFSDSTLEASLGPLERTGKPYLLKAQHCAFNISDSTTITLTVQNWQITSFVRIPRISSWIPLTNA